jgi:methionine-rich copper-binding protein CopC
MPSETNKGKTVSTGPAQVVRTDFKTMTVAMQGDDSEIYLVQWHTVSADDGDPDIGAFTFTVSTTATP